MDWKNVGSKIFQQTFMFKNYKYYNQWFAFSCIKKDRAWTPGWEARTILRPKVVTIILSVCGCIDFSRWYLAGDFLLEVLKSTRHNNLNMNLTVTTQPHRRPSLLNWPSLTYSVKLPSAMCCCNATTNYVHSSIYIHKLVHLAHYFTWPTFKAVLTMLAGSHTGLLAQAPFPKFHPDAVCAVILLKCKPQIQLCLLWLCWLSVNTQLCHNVAITAGQYFNNLFGQLRLRHQVVKHIGLAEW